MKKTLAAVFAGLLGAAFAGADNVVVSFSTPGPDRYADGTTVLDGEVYALVWTPTGSEFAGINADGTAKGDSKVAIKAPVAKDGKCPSILFQIDEDYAKANYPNGTWGVYLLDTRKFAVDVDGVVVKDGAGNDVVASVGGKAIQGYGQVGTADAATLGAASAVGAVVAGTATEVEIKAINIVEGNVYISVKGAGKFGLDIGSEVDALAAEGQDRAADGEAIIVRPAKAGGEFFKVIRK